MPAWPCRGGSTPHGPANLPQCLVLQSPVPPQVPATLRLPVGGPQARARIEVHVFPGATHGWDTRGAGGTYGDPAANRGRGGQLRLQRNPAVTEESTRRVVAFFTAQLAPR